MASKRSKKPVLITPEERQRRSDHARRLHQVVVDPTTGRRAFGGPQPGSGRPRKPRAAEKVAAEAQNNSDGIAQVFLDAIAPDKPIDSRVRAAQQWLKVEHDEAALQNAENRELAALSEQELIDRIASSYMRLAGSRRLDEALSAITGEPVIEGIAIEIDEDYSEALIDDNESEPDRAGA